MDREWNAQAMAQASRQQVVVSDNGTGDVWVGTAAAKHRHQLEVSYPMSNGVVQNWDDMCLVWDHTFYEQLCIQPRDCKIMLTEAALNPISNRHQMLEVMFEKFGFQAAHVQIQAVLTLYAQGLLTGLVVDSGDGVTHAVPVVDGYCYTHLSKRLAVAGRHVTGHLIELLRRRGYLSDRTSDFATAGEMKERLCYVAADYNRELKLAQDTTYLMQSYSLPDGGVIRLGPERFMAPEVLFNPMLADVESPGIAELAFNCIQEMDIDNRMQLYENIVISGGSTMYPGLPTRMETELKQLYLQRILEGRKDGMRKLRLQIRDPPNRKHLVFLGAAVLADIMKDRMEFWVTQQEWHEDPHRAVQRSGALGL